MTTPHSGKQGLQVGNYRLTGHLGAGMMGDVYEAEHVLIGRKVALKVLKARADEGLKPGPRLLEEARAANAVSHPGIVDIFDAGTLEDGRAYLVMERLVGQSLQQRFKAAGPLSAREVFHLLGGILEPLVALHRAGVIHRDLKPSNVFLCQQQPGMSRVKLLDFGIARRAARAEVLTQPLTTLGSMGFMGPEHLAGEVEPASDLYSLGCIAYLLLTGRPVFEARSPTALANLHLGARPKPLRAHRADVPPELEAWVLWLLEKVPVQRPSSAEVALAVLREAEFATTGHATLPGGPRFGELARAFDQRLRSRVVPRVTAPAPPPEPATGPRRPPPPVPIEDLPTVVGPRPLTRR